MKHYHPKSGDRFKAIHKKTGIPARFWPFTCTAGHQSYTTAIDVKDNLREFDNHSWKYEKL